MMVSRKRRNRYDAAEILQQLGMTAEHAESLLRISSRLRRWHELECGTEQGGIERDEKTNALRWYDSRTGEWSKYHGPDHETNSRAKLAKIMAHYPTLQPYIQGDPRGCALYILRPGDVPEGEQADSYYNRGIAVYRE